MTTLPSDTIEYEGEQFTINYNEFLTCGECGQTWAITDGPNPDEDYRDVPPKTQSCPNCSTSSGHEYVKRTNFYTKFNAVPIEDPPLDAQVHAESIRRFAMKLEALEANEWDMTQSDGVHIYFEKTEVESTKNDYKVTGDLE